MTDAVAETTKLACFNLSLVGGFAMLALVLAAIGVYGSTAYDSTRRTSEFGLRIALGARPFQVLGAALGHSIRLAALGLVVGLASALFIARALGDSLYLVRGSHNGVIYQVPLADPLTLALAGAILVVVTLVAAYMPVRKATRVSPVVALRTE
jgi:ABC-type antimicrobial peptide transport system permease subunit